MNIDKNIITKIKTISRRYDCIQKVTLFGSRARGDNKLTSDIDLAVYLVDSVKDKSLQVAMFSNDLEELDTLLKFDVVIMDEAMPRMFYNEIKKMRWLS